MADWISAIASAAVAFVESSSHSLPHPEPEQEPEQEPELLPEQPQPHHQPQQQTRTAIQIPRLAPPRVPVYRHCHHNLLRYVRAAVLPEMSLDPAAPPLPPPDNKSLKNPVFEQHELYRHLDVMNPINDFQDFATAFANANIPSTAVGDSDVDVLRNGRFTVPAPGYPIPQLITGNVTTLPEIVDWVRHYPLATARRIMHLLYPSTLSYKMQHLGTPMDRDKGIMECFKWAPDENEIMEADDLYRESVMFFVQPPWMLSSKDMDVFVCTNKFPNPWAKNRIRMQGHERLWSKVYDGCIQNHSHFFVITTYREWVFGAFSKEHSQAWTSDIMPFDTQDPDPTIMEYLVYWLASATASEEKLVDPWIIPKIYEPIFIDSDEDDEMDDDPNTSLPVAPSVSVAWSAHSSARSHDPSMQDSDDESTETVMDVREDGETEVPRRKAKRFRHGLVPSQIDDWKKSVATQQPVAQGGWWQQQAGTPSIASSASSVSTVRDYANQTKTGGTYLIGGPGPLGDGQPMNPRVAA